MPLAVLTSEQPAGIVGHDLKILGGGYFNIRAVSDKVIVVARAEVFFKYLLGNVFGLALLVFNKQTRDPVKHHDPCDGDHKDYRQPHYPENRTEAHARLAVFVSAGKWYPLVLRHAAFYRFAFNRGVS